MKYRVTVIETRKELHGWYKGKRECTAERLLINPYNGCSVGCFYCYARALPGYFEKFHNSGEIFVAKDFDKVVAEQIDSLHVASCGYLSPVTDPFQEVNNDYKLSEKIVKVFVERNLPVEVITKCRIPEEVMELMKTQKDGHCFCQVSILTCNEELRKILSPGGATTDVLFDNIYRAAKNGLYAVCRIDPIFPYITDDKKALSEVVARSVDCGARHIVASVLDIPKKIFSFVISKIKEYFGNSTAWDYKKLYVEDIGYINAKIEYRRRVFDFLRNLCDKKNITFALCMEYELKRAEGSISSELKPIGLNREYMSSINCEGINIPIYVREGKYFHPATKEGECYGNCLSCKEALCGIKDLAMGRDENTKKDWKLKDYRRWSREITCGNYFNNFIS
jgi:DNA repair photolyase